MLNHIALHCVPIHIGWYFDKRDQRLCQNCVTYPRKPPGQYGDLRGHVDAYRCCVKSLIACALVGFRVRQRA